MPDCAFSCTFCVWISEWASALNGSAREIALLEVKRRAQGVLLVGVTLADTGCKAENHEEQ